MKTIPKITKSVAGVFFKRPFPVLIILLVAIFYFSLSSIPQPARQYAVLTSFLALLGYGIFIFSEDQVSDEPRPKFRILAKIGIVIFIIIGLLPINSAINPALAFSPAELDETLIIVADFGYRSIGRAEIELDRDLYETIAKDYSGSEVRVEHLPTSLQNPAEGYRVLNQYHAAILIWGWYSKSGAEVHIQLDSPMIEMEGAEIGEESLFSKVEYVIGATGEFNALASYAASFSEGMLASDLRDPAFAETSFTQAIVSAKLLSPGELPYLYALQWRGFMLLESGKYDRALADFIGMVDIEPSYEGYFYRGYANSRLGRNAEAVRDFTAAIDVESKYLNAYYNRGLAYYYQQLYDRAIEDCTFVIDSDPGFLGAYLLRGLAFAGRGDYSRAIEDINYVLSIEPFNKDAFFNRAFVYQDQGRYEEAVQDYTTIIIHDRLDARAFFYRGNTYVYLRKYPEAIMDYTTAIHTNPNYPEAYVNRGWVLQSQGKIDEAIQDYTTAIAFDPQSAEAHYYRGTILEEQEKYTEAIEDYSAAIHIDASMKNAFFGRGNVYFDQGHFGDAITDYTSAIAIDPGYAPAYSNRGNAKTSQGRFSDAVEDLQIAISLDPNDPYAYCALGYAYVKLRDYPSAITAYEKGIELDINGELDWCRENLEDARQSAPTP